VTLFHEIGCWSSLRIISFVELLSDAARPDVSFMQHVAATILQISLSIPTR